MKKKFISTILIFTLVAGLTATVYASDIKRRDNLNSTGIFEYKENGEEKIVFNTNDLIYIADEIDAAGDNLSDIDEEVEVLTDDYRRRMLQELNRMGTYVSSTTNSEGEQIPVEGEPAHTGPQILNEDNSIPEDISMPVLIKSLSISQEIYGDCPSGLKTPDTNTPITGPLQPATSDNIAAGTAAWVNGEYIVGTGKDNEDYYAMGKAAGITGNVSINYHVHTTSGEAGEIRSASSYDAYNTAKASLSTQETRTSQGGCFTKPYYSATKTTRKWVDAQPGGQYIKHACGSGTYLVRDYWEDGKHMGVMHCGTCGENIGFAYGYWDQTYHYGTRAAVAAHWETTSTTTVYADSTSAFTSNTNTVVYSNIKTAGYKTACSKTQGQIIDIIVYP